MEGRRRLGLQPELRITRGSAAHAKPFNLTSHPGGVGAMPAVSNPLGPIPPTASTARKTIHTRPHALQLPSEASPTCDCSALSESTDAAPHATCLDAWTPNHRLAADTVWKLLCTMLPLYLSTTTVTTTTATADNLSIHLHHYPNDLPDNVYSLLAHLPDIHQPRGQPLQVHQQHLYDIAFNKHGCYYPRRRRLLHLPIQSPQPKRLHYQ